jgi:hypothetical protein
MRPIVAPGTRLRKVIDRMSQPLPESIRNLMLRLDYRREEWRTARTAPTTFDRNEDREPVPV